MYRDASNFCPAVCIHCVSLPRAYMPITLEGMNIQRILLKARNALTWLYSASCRRKKEARFGVRRFFKTTSRDLAITRKGAVINIAPFFTSNWDR